MRDDRSAKITLCLGIFIAGCVTGTTPPSDRFSCDTASWSTADFNELKSGPPEPLPEVSQADNLWTAAIAGAGLDFLIVRDAGVVRFPVNVVLGTQALPDSGVQLGIFVDGIELSSGYVQEGRLVERPKTGADGVFRFYKDVDFSTLSRSPHLVSIVLGLEGGSSNAPGFQMYSIGEQVEWDPLPAETPSPSQRPRLYQSQLFRTDGVLAFGRQSGRPDAGQYSFILSMEVDDRDTCPDAMQTYIVFATLDGAQHPLAPGIMRRVFRASRRVVSETNLTVSVPEDGGYHELQVYCVPTYGQFPSTPDGKETPASRFSLYPAGTAFWE
jgi:hypothetical protein